MIDYKRLQYLLDCDYKTGIFTWKNPTSIRVKKGQVAGSINKRGYVEIRLDKKLYYGHRLVWLYFFEEWPEDEIDHEDGVEFNNSLDNLRDATRQENVRNRGINKNNTSGFKGVSFYKRDNNYKAAITLNNKTIHLGYFDTAEEAYEEYVKAAKEYFKEFYRDIK